MKAPQTPVGLVTSARRAGRLAQPLRASLLTVCALWAVACGHPASERECQEIADRVAQLELAQNPAGKDPDTAKEQLARTRAWVKESSLKECVGRRITDSAMACVRDATRPEQITDSCFR